MLFIKRILIVALLALLLAFPAAMTGTAAPDSLASLSGETIHVAGGEVTVSMVFESQTGAYNGTIDVRAPADATITCQGITLDPVWNGSIATVDLGAHGLAVPADGNITLTASFPRDGDVVHRMLYDATVTVTVDSDGYVRSNIPLSFAHGSYTGTASLVTGEEVSISFPSPGRDEDGATMLYLGGGLAVGALAAGAAMFLLQRRRRDRYLEKEPVEVLEMRKKLLTQLLKQLEIERDKGKIADTYYQSIKDSFKEQAVEVMRELDRRS